MDRRDELIAELSTAARTTWSSFLAQFGRAELIGFALYSCEDLTCVGVIGATRSGQRRNQYCDADEFLFSTDEWDQMPAEDGTRRANDILAELHDYWYSTDDDFDRWYARYRHLVLEVSLRTLSDIVSDGLFVPKGAEGDLFLMLGVSDSMIPYREGVEWSKQLNTPSMHRRYCDWIRKVIDKDG